MAWIYSILAGQSGAMSRSQATIKPATALKGSSQGAATAFKAAASVTLKLPSESAALPYSSKDGNLTQIKKKMIVQTVWDDPRASGAGEKQQIKLNHLGAGVHRMAAAFEDATRIKEEKRQMMDDMHDHTLQQVESTRQTTETLLAELAEHIKGFMNEFKEKLRDNFDELDSDRMQRMAKVAARYDKLEARARSLSAALDEERAGRLRDTELIMQPIRKQVAELSGTLDKEQKIRRTRNAELNKRMEESVAHLQNACENELASGWKKREECQKECETELIRLDERRHTQVEKSTRGEIQSLKEDIDGENHHRKHGQDQIVERITDFIQRFQQHVREEGEMGD